MKTFNRGDRVLTPGGAGVILSVRMSPPDYMHAASYAVKLDSRKDEPGYKRTCYTADKVVLIKK